MRRELRQQRLLRTETIEPVRQGHVAALQQLGQRVEAVRRAGMAGDENEVAGFWSGLAPLEEVRRVNRLAVLVDAEETDVEVEARILEVVGVAAEEGDGVLRREDEADIGVFLVAVQVILAALVERDHVAAQFRLVERFFLDSGHDGACAANALPGVMSGLTASLTPAVTSSIDCRTFSSRSGHFNSSSRVGA